MRMLGRALTFREGLILQIKDAQGNHGEGEIAPLTGVHLESLEDAEKIWSISWKEKKPN